MSADGKRPLWSGAFGAVGRLAKAGYNRVKPAFSGPRFALLGKTLSKRVDQGVEKLGSAVEKRSDALIAEAAKGTLKHEFSKAAAKPEPKIWINPKHRKKAQEPKAPDPQATVPRRGR